MFEEEMGPCQFCIDYRLYEKTALNEWGDCPYNPDEYRKCELIRKAHGLPEEDEEE